MGTTNPGDAASEREPTLVDLAKVLVPFLDLPVDARNQTWDLLPSLYH